VANHGDWVLSGHFIGRAPYKTEFEILCRQTWPARSDRRVQISPLHAGKSITESLANLASYLLKFEETLFDTGGTRKNSTPQMFRSIQNAFHGPTLDARKAVPSGFDRNGAIRQWALFADRLGPDRLHYFNVFGRTASSLPIDPLLAVQNTFHRNSPIGNQHASKTGSITGRLPVCL
jgi:hypothetical protein